MENSVSSLGTYAFYQCTSLTSITLSNSIKSIGSNAFSGCSSVTSFELPNGVTSIGSYAFNYCIGLIYITNHAAEPQTINADVFTNVNLSSVTLYVPAESIEAYQNADVWNEFGTIKAIGEEPTPCLIASGTCGENLTWELSCDSVLTISGTGEMENYALGEDTVPWNSLKDNFTSLIINEGITSIGNYAFYNCTGLTSVTIPNSVTSIGGDAFSGCTGLISVSIGNNVNDIGYTAFLSCSRLTAIDVAENNPYYCSVEGVLFDKNKTKIIQYPTGNTRTSYTIPVGVNIIGKCCFGECSSLKEVTIPNSVTDIEWQAFANCDGLTSVTIPEKVTSIGQSAFWCHNMKTIYCLGEKPAVLGEMVFGSAFVKKSIYVPCGTLETYKTAWNKYSDEIQYAPLILTITGKSNIDGAGRFDISIPETTICDDAPTASITAIPNNGYRFVEWNDGDTNNPRSLILTQDTSFTAIFEENKCLIASGTCGENLTWELSCDSVLTISGTGEMEDYTSAHRSPWARYASGIKAVHISEGVISIGKCAFDGFYLLLTSVSIPNSVIKIGSEAFSGCCVLITSVPNSVTSIGNNAFYDVLNIYYQGDADGLPWGADYVNGYVDGYCVYSDETRTNLVTCSILAEGELIIPNSVVKIYNQAFLNCYKITTITIPESVTDIGNETFYLCSGLTSITIPNQVTEIGISAFNQCSNLESIIISNSVRTIGDYAFALCNNLKSVIINAVTPPTMGKNVFGGSNCANATLYVPAKSLAAYQSADIWNEFGTIKAIEETPAPCLIASGTCGENLTWELSCDSVLTISGTGEMTNYEEVNNIPWYEYSSSINSVIIDNGVTSIGNNAFWNCSNLTSIVIPNSVTSIGEGAFWSCINLTSIKIPNRVTSIGVMAFGYCYSLTSIEIPNSITNIERATFYACVGLTSITIPNSVTSIEEEAFLSCHYLPSITIPNSVTSIGKNAFSMVNNIVYSGSATGSPWGAKSINGYVDGYFVYSDDSKATLLGCSSAVTGEIVIPNSVTSIGTYAFNNCRKLTSVIISNNVISIGDFAFYQCDGLTAVSIPHSVTSIGEGAFWKCYGLKSVTNLSTNPQTINEWVFGSFEISSHDLLRSCTLYVPVESLAAYQNAEVWKLFGTIMPIKDHISIAEAVQIGMALDSMATSTGTYTIEGYVINADAFSSKYKYQNWYMTDDPKSASSDFRAHQCYPVDGVDTIAVFNGSRVRMTGQLHKYYNKATATYIIEMKRVSATILALPETDTITVAEALAIGEKLVIEESTGVPYTIRGYVSYIETPFDEQYKNQSFYIADDISTAAYSAQTGGFFVYRGKTADGMPIKEGAFVELTATIKKYSDAKIENAEQNVRITILKEAPECRNLAGVCGDNLTWTLKTCDSVLTISGTGEMRDYSRSDLAPWSHYGVAMAIIENGVTSLGKYAFSGSSVSSLSLSESVTQIAFNAFNNCYNLQNFEVNSKNPAFCSVDGVLFSKDQTTIVRFPRGRGGEYIIPKGVTIVGDGAFNGCSSVTNISIPEGVTSFGVAAFFACSMTSVIIPATVAHIDTAAFGTCPLTSVYNYAVAPQEINAELDVFSGVDLSSCALYVPAESVKAYQTADVWKDFGSLIPMQAEEVTEPITDVETQPEDNRVIVTWPVVESADTYTLEIKKNGELICTLTFSADGRLMGIAFAPARNGGNHAPAAIKTANGGLRFTVTGLNSGTLYDLDVIAKDDMNQTIKTYQKSFTTTGTATALDQIDQQPKANSQKLLINGQILILRGDKAYTLTGQELR